MRVFLDSGLNTARFTRFEKRKSLCLMLHKSSPSLAKTVAAVDREGAVDMVRLFPASKPGPSAPWLGSESPSHPGGSLLMGGVSRLQMFPCPSRDVCTVCVFT